MKMTINVDGYGPARVLTVDVDARGIAIHAQTVLNTRDDDGIAVVCDCGDGCDDCEPCAWDLYPDSSGSCDTWCSDVVFAATATDVDAYHVEDDRQLTDKEIRDAVATVAAAFAPEGV